MNRQFWVLLHRYCGLYMALFLIVAGLTGSVLAFYHELDGWLSPERSPEHNRIAVQDHPLFDPFELREQALKRIPEARIDLVSLEVKPDKAYSLTLQPRLNTVVGKSFPLSIDSITVNPYTGEEIERNPMPPELDGYFPLTRQNILQFVYALHYQLALGNVGIWLFWIAALIWTVDCFVGFYLTLPPRPRKHFFNSHTAETQQLPLVLSFSKKRLVKYLPISIVFLQAQGERSNGASALRTFWQRWKQSWLIKWPASFFRVNFDLHRASGLWAWLILFIFAWSSVMLEMRAVNNLPPVYDLVMKVFFEYPPKVPILDLPNPRPDPTIDFRTAHAIGKRLMSEQAKLHGFTVMNENLIYYEASKGAYLYGVCTDRDIAGICSSTAVYFDAENGKLLWLDPLPSGEYSGLTISTWLLNLHMASIWGLPYKLFVCLMGLVIAMLSVTGVYIWLKKRRAARLKRKVLV